jgi:hypothetical protein
MTGLINTESLLERLPPPDLMSTRVPTQGDGIPLEKGTSTVGQQKDLVLSAPVSSLGLECSSSGVSLGVPTLCLTAALCQGAKDTNYLGTE